MNEQVALDSTHVTFDYCAECAAVVRSDEPCDHQDLEYMNLIEW